MKCCSKCSKPNDENSKFCSNCGEAFSHKRQDILNENVKPIDDENVNGTTVSMPGFKKQITVIVIILALLLAYSMMDKWEKHQSQVAHEKIELEKKKKEEEERSKKNKELNDAAKKAEFVVNRLKKELNGFSEVSYDKETKTIKVANQIRLKNSNDIGKRDIEDVLAGFLQNAKDLKEQSPDHSYKIEVYYKNDPQNKYAIISDGNFIAGEWYKYLAGQAVKQVF
ncbi:zinc ribbon domain-containing protein [Bacillus cereus]|uniref:zinc ribbon domain-containing protein n=1 Tax=Bacillus cereus TaxID=1396 RepID=UPI000976A405|nr:zinc ribbon domain-containing protein [Bacillus cereus]ONH02269.1 hypothetical protein BKK45_01600 [Bacillus cereus]